MASQPTPQLNSKRAAITAIRQINLAQIESLRQEAEADDIKLQPSHLQNQALQFTQKKQHPSSHPQVEKASKRSHKNPTLNDTDKMIFEKQFKNYLNHKSEFQEKARLRQRSIIEKKKMNANESQEGMDQDDENLFTNGQDMLAAYQQIVSGKARKGETIAIEHCEKLENQLRKSQFQYLLSTFAGVEEAKSYSISKDNLLAYFFEEPCMMMLYSINPYLLADELAELETSIPQVLNFQEFSFFLLSDREPTYFDYSPQNLAEAKSLGRGLKCSPIIAKWVDQNGILQFLLDLFHEIDLLGSGKVDRSFLAKKIKKEVQKKLWFNIEVIEIVNINKKLPLSRLLFEIEYQLREDEEWTYEEFERFLRSYQRRNTPQLDKMVTKLILNGKYDSSYVYVLPQSTLDIFKQAFHDSTKFAGFFVHKQKYLQKIFTSHKYKEIQRMSVRSEPNRYIYKQSVEDTLARILEEGDDYLDLEEVLFFFTNRGRPLLVEHQVYLRNLQEHLSAIQDRECLAEDSDSTNSDSEWAGQVKAKRIQRKQQRLADTKQANAFQPNQKYNLTIPIPFQMLQRATNKKVTIREIKLNQMLQEKRQAELKAYQPIKPKEVPAFAKQNLLERIMKEQERVRQERLEKFRLEIIKNASKVSERLTNPKKLDLHCYVTEPMFKFIARPMPWYCEVNLVERINKQKQERREQILESLINRNSEYDLPEGVKLMIERQDQIQEKRHQKQRTNSTSLNECTFVPKITQSIPDFHAIHEHLHFDLENAKHLKQPVTIQPFSFENRISRSKTVAITHQPHEIERKKIFSRYDKKNPLENEESINIPKTMKFDAIVEMRRKQEEERLRKIQEERQSNAIRKMRQDKFAPIVHQVLKRSERDPSKSRAIIQEKIKQFRREERKKKQEYQNQMIKIYTKVFQRPLLIERIEEEERPSDKRIKYQVVSCKQKEKEQGRYPEEAIHVENRRRGHFKEEEDEAENERRRSMEKPPGEYEVNEDEENEEMDHQYLSENGHYTS